MNDAASAAPTYEQVIAAWNAQADKYNHWGELGEDEKIEWAVACAKATPPAVVEPPEPEPDGLEEFLYQLENSIERAESQDWCVLNLNVQQGENLLRLEAHHGIRANPRKER